jgi:hypothetical protein
MAAATEAAVLAAFLLAWGDGMPSLGGTVLDQTLFIQVPLVAAILPWVAARCRPLSPPAVRRLAAVRATPPAPLLIVRAVTISVALAVVALAGLPMVLLAMQVSAAPFSAMIVPAALIAAMLPFIALLSTWTELLIPSRMAAWLVTTGLTMGVSLLPAATAAIVFVAGSALGLAALGGVGNRVLRQAPPMVSTTHV